MAALNIRSDGALDILSLGALVHRIDPGIIPFRKATECSAARAGSSAAPNSGRRRPARPGRERAARPTRARGATGRDKIVKLEGCYHGHADSLLVKAGSGLLTFGNPTSAGVPAGTRPTSSPVARTHAVRARAPSAATSRISEPAPHLLRTSQSFSEIVASPLVESVTPPSPGPCESSSQL